MNNSILELSLEQLRHVNNLADAADLNRVLEDSTLVRQDPASRYYLMVLIV